MTNPCPRGVELRSPDEIEAERQHIKLRAEQLGFEVLEPAEMDLFRELFADHSALVTSEFTTHSNPNPCAADPVISAVAAMFVDRIKPAAPARQYFRAQCEALWPGWRLVPIEPTDEALVAGQEAWLWCRCERPALEDCVEARAVYAAMVSHLAAPITQPAAAD